MKEGSDCGGVGGGCSDSARVVDSVSTNSAADAASDLIVDVIVLFLGLWVVVRYIFEAIRWTITTDYCSYGGGIDETRDFCAIHATPFMGVRAPVGPAVVQGGSISVKI